MLLGTAYLFTEEALQAGAIVAGFQKRALECSRTVLLESGPGHAIRCVDTPYRAFFENEKQRLRAQGRSAEEARAALEQTNVGRLRIASKGITRAAAGDSPGSKFISLSGDEQHADGMYMIGQVAALRHETCTIAGLAPGHFRWRSSHLLEQFKRRGAEHPTPAEPRSGLPKSRSSEWAACSRRLPTCRKYWENHPQ